MKQRTFFTEAAYIVGILTMALGSAGMERAGFGLSMVVAPAYLIHLKIVEFLPWFSFGLAEDVFQAALLVVMCLLLRRFRASYLFSFVTAVLYGLCLDGAIALLALLPPPTLAVRVVLYVLGMVITSFGVACFYHTYIAPEVYELFVMEVTAKNRWSIHKFKTVYDCASCLLGIVFSFAFFGWGNFVGVQWGTVVCALVNGTLIGWFDRLFCRFWLFEDAFPALRRHLQFGDAQQH